MIVNATDIYSAPPTGPAVPLILNLGIPIRIGIDYIHQFFYAINLEVSGPMFIYVLDGFAADENIFSVRSLIALPSLSSVPAMAIDAELGLCYIVGGLNQIPAIPTLFVVNRDVFWGSRTLPDYDSVNSLVADPISHCVFVSGNTANRNPILTKYCWM
jgi:hypothetical protein